MSSTVSVIRAFVFLHCSRDQHELIDISEKQQQMLYSGLTLIGVAVGLAWFAGVSGSGVSIFVLAPSLPLALVWFVNSRENQGQQVSTMLGPPASPSLPQ